MAELAKHAIAVALGSNLGDRSRNLHLAVDRLHAFIENIRLSRLIESAALDCVPDAPGFLNAALIGTTSLTPHALLDACQMIERDLGRPGNRQRSGALHPDRTIDIDLLLYDQVQLHDDRLIIPHPHLTERSFVLDPLAQIAPDWIIPGDGRTIVQARSDLLGT